MGESEVIARNDRINPNFSKHFLFKLNFFVQELEGLKRAYAEMILNTAKEAAARVMASEIKARNFELDLISSKEEATRILLRLKHMMDAKVTLKPG